MPVVGGIATTPFVGFPVPKAIIRHAIWLYLRFNPTRVDELLSWRYDAALA